MKLLLRRGQRAGGLMGDKMIFTMEVRADLTPEEKANISKYKLGDTMLYQRFAEIDAGPGFSGYLASVARGLQQVEIQVRSLVDGTRFECKSILEMLAVEQQIKEAAANFVAVLNAAAKFGGEEVVEI